MQPQSIGLAIHLWVLPLSFACFASVLGGEPDIWACDPATRGSLQAFLGGDVNVKLCKLSDTLVPNKELKEATSRLTIFVHRRDIDPILVERLKNQGHRVEFVAWKNRDSGVQACCVRLRLMCKQLTNCFPARAEKFRCRLMVVEHGIRLRARVLGARLPEAFEET
ncbi:MAG: hypothetical protein AAF483_16165 [Planctomycetota bacterium]